MVRGRHCGGTTPISAKTFNWMLLLRCSDICPTSILKLGSAHWDAICISTCYAVCHLAVILLHYYSACNYLGEKFNGDLQM